MKRAYDDELIQLAKDIWEFAEIKFEEKKSAKAQMDLLKKYGFSVEDNLADIPTAFKAVYGTEGPSIGYLGEFDALSGLSQVEDALEKKEKVQGACGHGCGHHMLGTASLGAALQLKDYIESNHLKARVVYFGCPAEEGGSAKAFMAKRGVFFDADVALTWHPFNGNGVLTGSMQANKQVYVRFYGQGAHAAMSPELGRSALDALEIVNIGVNFLREHIKGSERIHYAITNAGGISPNVVQEYAEGIYLMRSSDIDGVDRLYERFTQIVQGAGLITQTKPEIIFDKACSNIVVNNVLEKVLYESFVEEGAMEFSKEEIEYAKGYRKLFSQNNINSEMTLQFVADDKRQDEIDYLSTHVLYEKILDYVKKETTVMGSSDVGDASNAVPTAQIVVACYAIGTPGHSWQEVAQGKSTYAMKGMLKAADVLAKAGQKLLEHPILIEEAKKELIKRRGDTFISPIPDGQIPFPLRNKQ